MQTCSTQLLSLLSCAAHLDHWIQMHDKSTLIKIHPSPSVMFDLLYRALRAGTELTWNYSYKTGSDPEHEVPCLCGSTDCQAVII